MREKKKNRSSWTGRMGDGLRLILSVCMVLGLFGANLHIVYADEALTEADKNKFSLVLLDNQTDTTAPTTAPFQFAESSEQEIYLDEGAEFWLGVKLSNVDTIISGGTVESVTAKFNYDKIPGRFEVKDVRLIDSSVPQAEADDHDKYTVHDWAWDAEEDTFTITNKSGDFTGTQLLLAIHLYVQKSSDDTADFGLTRVTVAGTDAGANPIVYVSNEAVDEYYSSLSLGNLWESETRLNDNTKGRHVKLATEKTGDEGAVKARTGKSISVPVYVEENTGFTYFDMKVKWDTDFMTYSGIELSPQAMVYAKFLNVDTTQKASGSVTFSVASLSDKNIRLKDYAKLLNINFSDVKGATTVIISVTADTVANADGTKVAGYATITRAVETLAWNIKGDVNGDNRVNLVDAAMVLQYYNGIRSFDENQIQAADVVQDNTSVHAITLVDVLKIMKEYNNGNVGELNQEID